MKIAVVGASGNVGTAVLRALHRDAEVTELVGISRRVPPQVEPYTDVEWHSIDVTAENAPERLADAFAGADAVIHLAWLIYPNHDRELIRRINVAGTEAVLDAVERADVRRVVVASSVGAYSVDAARQEVSGPEDTPPLRAEDFPARGVEGSHYSEDKGKVEELLEQFTAAHPDISVARLRPGLIFQDDAASEVQRFFLGASLPVELLDKGSLPVLPLPKKMVTQGVHADDVAQAYLLAAKNPAATGPFNICADDILHPQDFADILSNGRFIEVPPQVARAGMASAHKSGVLPADPGWLDMGLGVPLMDNARAKSELGWQPATSAKDALASFTRAMIEGAGHPSPSLWALDDSERFVPALGLPMDDAVAALTSGPRTEAGSDDNIERELVSTYLANHLAAQRGTVERADQMTLNYQDTPVFKEIGEVAQAERTDRAFLERVIKQLGLETKPTQSAAAWAGEKLGRFKPNGRAVSSSPLALLVESEALYAAAAAKHSLWRTLFLQADNLVLNADACHALAKSAQKQLEATEAIHAYAAQTAFAD